MEPELDRRPEPESKHRLRRVVGAILVGLVLVVVFASALVGAVLLHLDHLLVRRLVVNQTNAILRDTFAGEVRVERLEHLGLGGLAGVRAKIRDPEGVLVVDAAGVTVRVRTIALLRSLAFDDKAPIEVAVDVASIGNADVNLDTGANGELRIANAFLSKEFGPPKPDDDSPARGVHVRASEVRLGHAWVHGTPPGALRLDVDVAGLAGKAEVIQPNAGPKEEVTTQVRAELDRLRFVSRGMPRRLDPAGVLSARFAMPARSGKGIDVEAIFEGNVGAIAATAEARLDDDRIDARVDARDPSGAGAQALASEVTIKERVELHAEAHGSLPQIHGEVKVDVGNAAVRATSDVTIGPVTRIDAKASVRRVDLAALVENGPKSELGLDATGRVSLHEGGAVDGEAAVDTLPGTLDGKAIPRIEVRGRFTEEAGEVRARTTTPDLGSIDAFASAAPRPGVADGRRVALAVRSRTPRLAVVPQLGALLGGSADVDASAELLLPEKALSGDVTVRAQHLDQGKGAFLVDAILAKVRASGTLERPVFAASVDAQRIHGSGFPVPVGAVSVRTKVALGPAVGEAAPPIAITDTDVDVRRLGMPAVHAAVARIQIAGSRLRVEGAEVQGLGEPIRADLGKQGDTFDAKIDAPRIDLPAVARLLDKPDLVSAGTVAIRGEGKVRPGHAKASAHVEVAGLRAKKVKDARAIADASIDEENVGLELHAALAEAGTIDVTTQKLTLGGRFDDPKSWEKAHGKVEIDSAVDVERLGSLVPLDKLPLADLRGQFTLQARAGRDSAGAPPEIQLHAHTRGLVLAGKATSEPSIGTVRPVAVERANGWRSTNLDLGIDFRNDGPSGLTTVAVRATDAEGPITALDAKAILPYDAILADPSRAQEHALVAPIAVKLVVPRRRLDHMPSILGLENLQGEVDAELDLEGTARDPKLHLVAHGRGVRTPTMAGKTTADADVDLAYDGAKAALVAKAGADGRELLDLATQVDIKIADLLDPAARANLPWRASGRARLAEFPLELLPPVADRRVRGSVRGEVAVDGLHEDATLKGKLELTNLAVGRVRYERGSVTLDASQGKLVAAVRLEQKDGFADARATAGMIWGREIAPALDRQRPLEARLQAKAFRAAAIQPFIESAVPVLDGRIDADARLTLAPNQPAQASGKVTLRDGTLQLAALGEELRQVKATVTLAPDGSIELKDTSAKGSQGEILIDGKAKLDGMRLAQATANVKIPDRKAIDLTVNGTPLGEVAGTIRVQASQSPDGNRTALVVDIPALNVELPQVTKTGVQELSEKENIRIGVYRNRRQFVRLPLDKEDVTAQEEAAKAKTATPGKTESGMQLDIDVRLGKIVIQRGNTAKVEVTGNTKVVIGAPPKVPEVPPEVLRDPKAEKPKPAEEPGPALTGQIRVVTGWADVQGKKFEVEKGIVTFNGESPPNPVIVATAGWTAADNTHVFVDYVGPVKGGKIVMRSEPPRPKNEILALVLFGTVDGANPTPPPPGKQPDGTTKAAVGLGGGFAAQGLTEALDDLAGIQATARIDTTRSNNPRPEVEFQVSPRVSVGFAHVIGTPPITEPDKNLANVDWRFHRNWSLETTVGDRGRAMIDAIWQKRY